MKLVFWAIFLFISLNIGGWCAYNAPDCFNTPEETFLYTTGEIIGFVSSIVSVVMYLKELDRYCHD